MKKKYFYILAAILMAACTYITVAPNDDDEPSTSESVSIPDMVYVKGGTFTMSCDTSTIVERTLCIASKFMPTHRVTLSSYYIGKYEVTQKEWLAVMGSWPNKSKAPSSTYGLGDNYPAYGLTWDNIVGTSGSSQVINGITYYSNGFIYKLNQKTGKKYRLPTEAEWEYAARGGASSKGYKFSGSNTADDVGWYEDNSSNTTHIVGGKQANELGIYDMSGNVYEWCADWYDSYSSAAQTNPTGPTTGDFRVLRGGDNNEHKCSMLVYSRWYYWPDGDLLYSGFRLACSSY
jgi:formylglycine-generating enzyme required for sulfatase activity